MPKVNLTETTPHWNSLLVILGCVKLTIKTSRHRHTSLYKTKGFLFQTLYWLVLLLLRAATMSSALPRLLVSLSNIFTQLVFSFQFDFSTVPSSTRQNKWFLPPLSLWLRLSTLWFAHVRKCNSPLTRSFPIHLCKSLKSSENWGQKA